MMVLERELEKHPPEKQEADDRYQDGQHRQRNTEYYCHFHPSGVILPLRFARSSELKDSILKAWGGQLTLETCGHKSVRRRYLDSHHVYLQAAQTMKITAFWELISTICVIFAATGLSGCSSEISDRVSDNADDDADTDVDKDEQVQKADNARPASHKPAKSITAKTPDTVEVDAGDVTVIVKTKDGDRKTSADHKPTVIEVDEADKTGTRIKIDIGETKN
jgi:hypothetical protein